MCCRRSTTPAAEQGLSAMARTTPPKSRKPKKVEAHRTLWSVVVFHGKGRGLVGLYPTKAEGDRVAQKGHQRFVLPPVAAWGGKNVV
jgi:hypothetical protein